MATVSMDGVEFEGHSAVVNAAWHNLCVGVLLQAVQRMAAEMNLFNAPQHQRPDCNGGGFCKERIHQKAQAREWLDGGQGVITYEEACEELGVDPDRAREKILAWCQTKKRSRLPHPDYYGGGDV